MSKRPVVARSAVEGRSAAILRHRVAHFGRAVSRCRPSQVALGRFRCRWLSLQRVYPVVILAVALPWLARVCRSEAIRDGGHEIILVRIDFVVVVKDIGVARLSRWLVVVVAASVHDAERSLSRKGPWWSPLQSSPTVKQSFSCGNSQYSARSVAMDGARVASVAGIGVCRVVKLVVERGCIRFGRGCPETLAPLNGARANTRLGHRYIDKPAL
jgi:hypothetical protein